MRTDRSLSDEIALARTALAHNASIFGCDEFVVFSNVSTVIAPGEPQPGRKHLRDVSAGTPLLTTRFHGDLEPLHSKQPMETILNANVFMRVWDAVLLDGRYGRHDWVVKVDPDTVFFPDRLKQHLLTLSSSSKAKGMYFLNCKKTLGFFGALEVISRSAVETYFKSKALCRESLPWERMGEDFWMHGCLGFVGVEKEIDYDLLSDSYCDEQPSPCVSNKVAFHPFKTALSYSKCYSEAMNLPQTDKHAVKAKARPRHSQAREDDNKSSAEMLPLNK
jgi:hypothetical protein